MEPYQPLWHMFEVLQNYVKDEKNPEDHRDHVSVLMDFLVHCDMPSMTQLIALSMGTNVENICYSNLWFLFPRRTMVVTQQSDLHNSLVLQVTKAIPPTKRIDNKGNLSYHNSAIECEQYAYRRGDVKMVKIVEPLKPFEGALPIIEL